MLDVLEDSSGTKSAFTIKFESLPYEFTSYSIKVKFRALASVVYTAATTTAAALHVEATCHFNQSDLRK